MADEKESLVQTVKRNITPELDTSRSALPKEERLSADQSPQQEGQQLYDENFGSPAQQAYGKMKNWLSTHEQHFSDKVLKPFRQGLDNMGNELVEKGLDTHIPLLAAAGEAMKAVPVGKNVKETAAALVTPPELSEENLLGKSLDKLSKEVPPTVEHFAASETEPAKAVLSDATGKKIGQAKWTTEGSEAHLNGIYVDTKGKGHGKMLLEEVANKAKESGAKGLTVGKVNSATPDAISLFDRHKTNPVEKVETTVKGSQARRINFEPKVEKPVQAVEKTANPKDIIEKEGLKYKGEVSPGSGVHMFEHPDHPGKTASLKESQVTPEGVRTKMDSKLKEFEAGEKMKSEAKTKGSADL